jgi:hypothetical protein
MAYGQMESPWPVPGSVLVENGAAFFAAGRHPNAEDGVHVCAVRVETGQRRGLHLAVELACCHGPTT